MYTLGIVACSNGQRKENRSVNDSLVRYLENRGKKVAVSSCIYEKDGSSSGSAKERAQELNAMFADPDMEEIYDISGGDMANQILTYLDYPEQARPRFGVTVTLQQ